MKYTVKNTLLMFAIACSVMVHSTLLMLDFVQPKPLRLQSDPALEVILVHAKQDKKPLKADALAQANLEGGAPTGSEKAGAPLSEPPMQASQRRISELEQKQQQLLAQIKNDSAIKLPKMEEKNQLKKPATPDNPTPVTPPVPLPVPTNQRPTVSKMAAEITQTIESQSKRPRKTFITVNTQEVGYAMYYKALQKRIEQVGTFNFPQKDGKKLYGKLMVYIPVFQDGTIYQKDGGARIEVSSGIPELDQAALDIVRRAAPFGRFPSNMRATDQDDLWVIVTRFNFTREQGLETELR